MRNRIFAAIICSLLASPAILCLLQDGLSLNLPDWLTSKEAEYLSGDAANDTQMPLSIDAFVGKDLQNTVEEKVGDRVPCKGAAMLGNAALQRSAIMLSNTLFQWDCYQTFYGSSYVYSPEETAVAQIPWQQSKQLSQGVKRFGKRLNEFAGAFPDVAFCVYIPDISQTSSVNPAANLVSAPVNTQDVMRKLSEKIVADNVCVLGTSPYKDTAAYYQDFFKSDHHWNARGALSAYNQLQEALGWDCPLDVGYARVEGPLYSGAYARSSLCLVEDDPIELNYDFSSEVMNGAQGPENGGEHLAYNNASWENKHWQFYDLFYELFPEVEGAGEEHTVLLVSDSFGGALLRPLGMAAQTVACRANMHAAASSEEELRQLVEETNADTVIFVGHAGNYGSFMKRNPNFFDVSQR